MFGERAKFELAIVIVSSLTEGSQRPSQPGLLPASECAEEKGDEHREQAEERQHREYE